MQLILRLAIFAYFKAAYRLSCLLGCRVLGIGILMSKLKEPFAFAIHGRRFQFEPNCGVAFSMLPAGIWLEPETHMFFSRALSRMSDRVTFIDVGASIGEMAIDVAGYPQVERVIAFEPQRACADAIVASATLNGFRNVEVVNSAVGNESGVVMFAVDTTRPTASHVASGSATGVAVPLTTLDAIKLEPGREVLLLIDVEGHEPAVLRGAKSLIADSKPLVIFEYNKTSKQHFCLADIQNVLGPDYEIYRLNSAGKLDLNLVDTWNCVAVNKRSKWAGCCDPLLV